MFASDLESILHSINHYFSNPCIESIKLDAWGRIFIHDSAFRVFGAEDNQLIIKHQSGEVERKPLIQK